MDEKKLIAECLKGKAAAQQELYEHFSRELYGVSLRYARDAAQAQDILQESFIRIFRYLKDYQGKGSLGAWTRRIVVNVALRMIQSSALKNEIYTDQFPDIPADTDVIADLTRQELLDVLQQLPTGYRAVFNLFVIEGYSHAEIGAALGIEESTSRSQLTKAKKMLRQLILIQFPEYEKNKI